MKDIAVGIVIILVCFLIIDFLYTEKNTCDVGKVGYNESAKCGFVKEQFNVDIKILGRYW